MKTPALLSPLLLAAAALSSVPARAGTYVEETQSVNAMGQQNSVTMKTWIDGASVLVQDPRFNGTLLIVDTKHAVMTGVDPGTKTYWTLKESDLQQFGQNMGNLQNYGVSKGADGKLVVPPNIFEKTGKTKQVDGLEGDKPVKWSAYEVKVKPVTLPQGPQGQSATLTTTMWFAKVKGYDPRVQSGRLRMFVGDGPQAMEFMKQWDALEGVPVLTENKLSMNGQAIEIRQELKKVNAQKTTPEQFSVPAGFKQVEDPFTQMKRQMQQQQAAGGMPGGPGGQQPPPMAPPPAAPK